MPDFNLTELPLHRYHPDVVRNTALPVLLKNVKGPRRADQNVTIGRYVRDISVKARSMLGRPQRGVLSLSRPTESVHADREPDPREDPMWGARDVVSSDQMHTPQFYSACDRQDAQR